MTHVSVPYSKFNGKKIELEEAERFRKYKKALSIWYNEIAIKLRKIAYNLGVIK